MRRRRAHVGLCVFVFGLYCAFRFSLSKVEMKQVMAYLPEILQKYPSTSPQPNPLQCPYPLTVACTADEHYRTYDGRCNNLRRPLWGSPHQPLARFIPPDYADGKPKCHSEILNFNRLSTIRHVKVFKMQVVKTKQQSFLLLQ